MSISVADSDKIRVSFTNTTMLYDHFGQQIEEGSFIEKVIPTQFANAAEAKAFDALQESV